MKKHIGFVALDSSLVQWLLGKLRTSEVSVPSTRDLIDGLEDLMDGSTGSLMLELAEGEFSAAASDVICCGALSIDLRLRRVSRNGMEISLTPKEFDILYFLARNRGEVFTKEQIYQAVWENDYLLDDSNIMAFIRKLRKKIEPNPDSPEYILTIWGIGYKFNDKL
jgi:DNA-binding response OmpR family regulator